MFREMLLIHRNQIVFPNRRCMLGFSGFSGTKFSTREFVLQEMGIEAGGLEECKDKMVHVSFALGFLKSHLALSSGMAEHKDSHQPSRNQILTREGNTGGIGRDLKRSSSPALEKVQKNKAKKAPKNLSFRSTSVSANIRSPMNQSCIACSLMECVFTRLAKWKWNLQADWKLGLQSNLIDALRGTFEAVS